MDFDRGVEILAERGLNLFASAPLAELPLNLREFAADLEIARYSICVLGHGGGKLWERLPHPLDPDRHPVDGYSLEQIDWFAREVLRDKEYILAFPRADRLLPLQRIGRFLNLSRPSLLGLDMSEEFGVWFAYRAVFLTGARIPRRVPKDFESACASCEAKPCRTICPAGAVGETSESFNLRECATSRLRENSACADRCLARMVCPYQARHQYSLPQIRYHMARPAHLRRLAGFRD